MVITGLGAVTPVGIGVKAFWQALRDGVSGTDTITLFDPSPYPCRVAAEVKGFEARDFMKAKTAALLGRFAAFGVAAARMAHEDASVPRGSRFAVCFGSSINAANEIQDSVERFLAGGMRRIHPSLMLQTTAHGTTAQVTSALGLTGQTMTVASGCVTGLDVVQWSYQQVSLGLVAGVVAGATETPVSSYTHASFCGLRMLSRWSGHPARAVRPFDAVHDGFVLGEGAAAFVLEDLDHARARGARVYAEVLGYGTANECASRGAVDPTGTALRKAAHAALASARLEASEIDYVSAHGNALPDYDRAETAAYRALFGRHAYNIPVSSIKPMTGQSLSAAGALQVVAACFTLEEQFVPPTLNHDSPDPECDLDYVPNAGRVARVNRILVAAHALGGTHSALVLGRPPRY